MTLSYDNIFDAVSESPEQALLDKKCSDLMIKIHGMLDLRNAPIKTIVQALGLIGRNSERTFANPLVLISA
jgi:hypothetical protein